VTSNKIVNNYVLSHRERSGYRPASLDDCLVHLRKYFDTFAVVRDIWRRRNIGYHLELVRYYRYHVQSQASVLELGCGTGDLLAALEPACGVGVDISPVMIERAKAKHASLEFICGAAETVDLNGRTFDTSFSPIFWDTVMTSRRCSAVSGCIAMPARGSLLTCTVICGNPC